MVVAPERAKIKERIRLTQPQGEARVEFGEEQGDPEEIVKFLEAITGRKIRQQTGVDCAGIQLGVVSLYGEYVGHHINGINDSFRDHPDFDVIAGSGYTKVDQLTFRAVQLLVRPGLNHVDLAMLAGSIPPSVPLNAQIVYKEWDRLIPDTKIQKRVTHTSHRLLPGENPRLRLP